jgi:hypothetical protein
MEIKLHNSIVLFLTATILFVLICPMWFIITNIWFIIKLDKKRLSRYYWKLAIGLDQFGGLVASNFFNWFFIKRDGYQLGNPDETVSSWLGKNKKEGKLLFMGKLLDWMLEKIDPNHSIDAIEADEDSEGYR